jgi:secondary thiamine-phosphate synthase enzyme
MLQSFKFSTTKNNELINITPQVSEIIKNSGVQEGLCIIYSPHTTAGITITTISDPETVADILGEFDRLVPIRATFQHTLDTPADAAGHIKMILVGNSVNAAIVAGDLHIGHSQYIIFYEFDGPRDREVEVQIIATSTPV